MSETDGKKDFDAVHYLGFLPGAHDKINLLKRTFYTKLVENGLTYMYDNDFDVDPDSPILRSDPPNVRSDGRKTPTTQNPKHIIVVGAGMSGLAAAYELKRAGHKVTILEKQERVGGRVKTLHFDFDPEGLIGEAGAMRIPYEKQHYLTDFYINKFELARRDFYNEDPQRECFIKIQNHSIRKKEFDENTDEAKHFCDTLWPGWDARIKKVEEDLHIDLKINNIAEYFRRTIQEVTKSAPKGPVGDPEKYTKKWREWMERWSKMSFIEFLLSDLGSEDAKSVLRPWPKVAIDGICNINHVSNASYSVATILAETVGGWSTPVMYTLKNGMHQLPEAFVQMNEPLGLHDDLRFGVTVRTVEWQRSEHHGGTSYPVRVHARQTRTGNELCFSGDAVIMTLPLNIMRQIEFHPYLPQDVIDAIKGIDYQPATKIFLGFRERFWSKTKYPVVNGGISSTNLPIGNIVYPRENVETNRGVILLYTWEKDALLFGAQSQDEAISEALRELQYVYEDLWLDGENPNTVTDLFEAGAMEAWYSDPSSEGAYVHLLPHAYMAHLRTLLVSNEIRPIYFAGEAISFANGWIQGALESGLRAAWQFYKTNEKEQ